MSLTKATYSMIEGAPINVLDYGADPTGVADSLTAMQAAHNTGQIVYYPAGTYRFSGQLTIALGGIIGDGKTLTNLNAIDTSSNAAIKYTGAYTTLAGGLISGPPTFHDFTLNGNLLKTTGAGLQFESATNEVSYADLRGVLVSYFPINIDFVKASLWKMIGCDILGHTIAGVRVINTFDNDAGDAVIMGCVISTTVVTADNILHFSSGGLKIIGNKLLGGRHGYSMQYTGTSNTSVLIIANNSIENFSGQAITFAKISAGLTEFLNVVISGNEISISLSTTPALLISNDADGWLKVVNITGNILQLPGVTNSFGVALTGVTTLTISGNTFRGNGLNSTAIALTSCVDAQIGTNTYGNIAVPYTLITQGTNNTVAFDSQSGAATGVLNTTATTLFALPITSALYEVYAYLAGGGITYQSAVRIASDGTTLAIVGGDAAVAGMLITVSGLNIQANQNSGSTQTVGWAWRRIA